MDAILESCLSYCCYCCSCYGDPRRGNLYEPLLMEEEKEAANDLLSYLNTDSGEKPTINERRFRALCVLTYSENVDLQRSAALWLAEISEKLLQPITLRLMKLVSSLLESGDMETQKAASLALNNLAVHGPDCNKDIIVKSGGLRILIRLLRSSSLEVKCNVCGCITSLATSDINKREIVVNGGVKPLLVLAKSQDIRVRRNAAGALLNLTHIDANRQALVSAGAIPVFVALLSSDDTDVQYYCSAALSNLAVDESHRKHVSKEGNHKVLRSLIRLLDSPVDKVKCQACFALRNLASDESNQVAIVELGSLPPLLRIIKTSQKDTLSAAVAAVRNLSIHRQNETPIVQEGFLKELCRLLYEPMIWEVHCHAAGTLRNLAAGDHIKTILSSGGLESLVNTFMQSTSPASVQTEVTAALAVISSDDDAKQKLLNSHSGRFFGRLINLAVSSPHSEVQYNSAGIIGQVALLDIPSELLRTNILGLLKYLERFLRSKDTNFVHIALWTCVQLLKDESFRTSFRDSNLPGQVRKLHVIPSLPGHIKDLAATVLEEQG
ncbi:vacuolar protein 8-like [Anneissia japonica]|uniref:vacuolar protein 8-like n=1 Tax=Anneissia japonica TaxID=1529436 RepID=UPI0014258D9D|nr:vacuolar protein 8-like [Anneissia japonica]